MNLASAEVRNAAKEFVTFLNRAVTPYHAVEEWSHRLKAAGFVELKESDNWQISPLKKYFVTKNKSTLYAFAVGGAYRPGNGYSVVVGHTDSPTLRVKPISHLEADKFLQVGVSVYGGGLWRTWFDRDLSVAGRVIIKKNDGTLASRLVNIGTPMLYVPSLAIHLEADREKFEYNKENHLKPILASIAADQLNNPKKDPCEKQCTTESELQSRDPRSITEEHHPAFLKAIADKAGCSPQDIVDLDLYLYDVQPAAIGGLYSEFISGARLDNLIGTYTAVQGLLNSLDGDEAGFQVEPNIRIAACFDNEECGSESAQGACSAFTEWMLRRLTAVASANGSNGTGTAFEEAIAKSYLISADQAHAAHPNYGEKHEKNHRPTFHGGVVVKVNSNQRYATTPLTHAVLKHVAHLADVPLQKMVIRNDSPCGSTVGPILSAKLGLQTVDVGCPQLAMHSIREFADTSSIYQATKLYSTFFKELPKILSTMEC